jgi:cysteine synthase B
MAKRISAQIFEPERVDRVMDVSQKEATLMARQLAKVEGIFAGMSSGGAAQLHSSCNRN